MHNDRQSARAVHLHPPVTRPRRGSAPAPDRDHHARSGLGQRARHQRSPAVHAGGRRSARDLRQAGGAVRLGFCDEDPVRRCRSRSATPLGPGRLSSAAFAPDCAAPDDLTHQLGDPTKPAPRGAPVRAQRRVQRRLPEQARLARLTAVGPAAAARRQRASEARRRPTEAAPIAQRSGCIAARLDHAGGPLAAPGTPFARFRPGLPSSKAPPDGQASHRRSGRESGRLETMTSGRREARREQRFSSRDAARSRASTASGGTAPVFEAQHHALSEPRGSVGRAVRGEVAWQRAQRMAALRMSARSLPMHAASASPARLTGDTPSWPFPSSARRCAPTAPENRRSRSHEIELERRARSRSSARHHPLDHLDLPGVVEVVRRDAAHHRGVRPAAGPHPAGQVLVAQPATSSRSSRCRGPGARRRAPRTRRPRAARTSVAALLAERAALRR